MEKENKTKKETTNHKNEDRVQAESILIKELQEDMEEDEPFEPLELNNIGSFLLIFSPEELSVIACIIGIIISNSCTLLEQAVIGSFLTALGDNIFILAAQQALINSALDEQKAIEEREKEIIAREKEKIKKGKEKREKEALKKEIEDIKTKLNKLEGLLNKQLSI